jgi:hypothetical protein
MRYTRSRDGIRRATLHLGATMRLTREEVQQYTRMAQRLGYRDLPDYCAFHVKQLVYSTLPEAYEHTVEFDAQIQMGNETHRSEKG